ncbi:MAG: hypothetical protein KKA81_11705 [Bacteroidetes bacterium]|nr:hypothetical protein [Bacteroidota bacterium]
MEQKKKKSRVILKIIISVIVVLIIAIAVIPLIFKSKIMEMVKQEINKQITARVDFKDFGVSLIPHFPNMSFHLDELTVIGVDDFQDDTLASVKSVSAVINLMSLFKGEAYEIKSIGVAHPVVKLKVLEEGQANWDIFQATEEAPALEEQTKTESSGFKIALRRFTLENAYFYYDDIPGKTYLQVDNLNHMLSGNFSQDQTSLDTRTTADGITVVQDGIPYLNRTRLDFNAILDADLKNSIYKFSRNRIILNALILEFDGSVAMSGEDIQLMLTFNAPENTFSNILSMVPAIYMKDFSEIQTQGNFTLSGYVKGVYNENTLPSFGLDLAVNEGSFRYPDLPGTLADIRISANVENKGGDIDNTVVQIDNFHFSMMGNPFDIKLLVKTPVSDPFINAAAAGKIDLSHIEKIYPLEEGETMKGLLEMNISMEGHLSTLEKEEYEKFRAMGSLLVKGLEYRMPGYTHPFLVSGAQLNFSPAYLDLVNLDFSYASSDMRATGKVVNYLSYVFGKGQLQGNLETTSRMFNADDFMEAATEETTVSTETVDTTGISAFRVPGDIDFTMNSHFTKLIYDGLSMTDIHGQIIIRDEQIRINNLSGKIFEGSVSLAGLYDTRDEEKPYADMTLKLSNIDIGTAFGAFSMMEKFAPIAAHTAGNFSTEMKLNTILQQDMTPDWKTLAASGLLNTSKLTLENVNTLNRLSDVLKTDKFRKIDLNAIRLFFEVADGRINVKPFDMVMKDAKATVSGWTSLDQSIDYVMNLQIPRSVLGAQANDVLQGLVDKANKSGTSFSLGETINLDVLIGGTVTDPKVSTDLSKSGKSIVDDMKQNIQQELDKKKEELEQQAKAEAQKILDDADKEAKQILDEAQRQADNVKSAAQAAAQKAKDEAAKQSQKLIDEAKKQGPLAELAAKKTAGELVKEADKKAAQIIAEGSRQSDGIMQKARQEAEKVKEEARKKVN